MIARLFAAPFLVLCFVASANADPIPRVPVDIHAYEEMSNAAIQEWLDEVNRLFAQARICFELRRRHVLPENQSRLQTYRDRHRLKRRIRDGAINVFIVREMINPRPSASMIRAAARVGRVPRAGGRLAGATIPVRERTPRRYIIVHDSRSATLLAHEFGHALGAPHHPDPRNIMSYGRGRDQFSERQIERFHRTVRRYWGPRRRATRRSVRATPRNARVRRVEVRRRRPLILPALRMR